MGCFCSKNFSFASKIKTEIKDLQIDLKTFATPDVVDGEEEFKFPWNIYNKGWIFLFFIVFCDCVFK